jgi:acyl-CoA thioesterase I
MRLNEKKARGGFRGGAFAALLVVGVAAGSAILLAPVGHKAYAGGDRCGVTDDLALAARPLPHVAARLAEGGTLTIVALGSSSTSGTGASKPENTYPSRLAAVLAEAAPGVTVRVVNRGVPGEEAQAMAARIDRDVLREKPDLVIWQVGTNGVLRNEGATKMGEVVRAGIARLKAAGADVMIMNPQYAPAVLQHPHYREVLHVLDAVAYAEDVPLFPRFAMMRHWVEDGRMPLGMMLTRDRLHMTDVSYDCLARQIATGIERIVGRRPIEASRQPAKLNG